MEIHPSARRHGIADDDMLHAIEQSIVVEDIGEDPDRWLLIGPIVLRSARDRLPRRGEGDELLIHAMPLRAAYRKLLDP